jgi:hypothetical protein
MDRIELSENIIQEMAAVFADEVRALRVEPGDDLDTTERRLQEMGRRVWGQVASAVVRIQGEALGRPERCAVCGEPVRLVGARRVRQARGLVGDITLERAAYVCTACPHGMIPLDAAMGLGPWGITPGLARVIGRAGLAEPPVSRARANILSHRHPSCVACCPFRAARGFAQPAPLGHAR